MFDHISVDFDGTLFVDGKVDKELVDKINAKYNGKVFIFTSRSWGDYYLIKNILLEAGLKFESLVCGKLMCGEYLDDRNLKIDEFKKTEHHIIPNHCDVSNMIDKVLTRQNCAGDDINSFIEHSEMFRCIDCKFLKINFQETFYVTFKNNHKITNEYILHECSSFEKVKSK